MSSPTLRTRKGKNILKIEKTLVFHVLRKALVHKSRGGIFTNGTWDLTRRRGERRQSLVRRGSHRGTNGSRESRDNRFLERWHLYTDMYTYICWIHIFVHKLQDIVYNTCSSQQLLEKRDVSLALSLCFFLSFSGRSVRLIYRRNYGRVIIDPLSFTTRSRQTVAAITSDSNNAEPSLVNL